MFAPPAHVKIADVGGDLVFLDLARDEYVSVGRDAAAAIRSALQGSSGGSDAAIDELVEAGLIEATDRAPVSPFVTRSRPIDCPGSPDTVFRIAEFAGFVGDALFAARSLARLRPLDWHRAVPVRPARHVSDDTVFAIAARFRTFRCLIPRTGRCLVQSMMLVRHLRRRGIACEWVFGVRTHPFAAHCWVEARGAVLNDFADHVAWYVPIAIL